MRSSCDRYHNSTQEDVEERVPCAVLWVWPAFRIPCTKWTGSQNLCPTWSSWMRFAERCRGIERLYRADPLCNTAKRMPWAQMLRPLSPSTHDAVPPAESVGQQERKRRDPPTFTWQCALRAIVQRVGPYSSRKPATCLRASIKRFMTLAIAMRTRCGGRDA